MRDAAAANADAVDDAFIIAVARAAQAKGMAVQYDQPIIDGNEITVGVSISLTMRVPPNASLAHGRRLALAALLEMADDHGG